MSNDDPVQQLVARAKRGDSEAVSQIYQLYVARIYRYIVYRVGTQTDAEDLTAEVFVRMVESISRYKDRGVPFDAWLFRIASARVADFHRKQGRRPTTDLTERMVDSEPLPEERLLKRQEENELRNALRQLSKDDQKVLVLRFVERKSHQDVATILNKSVAAVKSIQHRALLRLAVLLGSEEKARHYLRGRDDER